MLHQDKVDRALNYQREQKDSDVPEYYTGEKMYEPTMEDIVEKGDMPALILSAIVTIVPIALVTLLVIVFIARLLFRIF